MDLTGVATPGTKLRYSLCIQPIPCRLSGRVGWSEKGQTAIQKWRQVKRNCDSPRNIQLYCLNIWQMGVVLLTRGMPKHNYNTRDLVNPQDKQSRQALCFDITSELTLTRLGSLHACRDCLFCDSQQVSNKKAQLSILSFSSLLH